MKEVLPASYNWIGANNGSILTALNWSPTRTTASTTDILNFNKGGTFTVTGLASNFEIGQIHVLPNSSTGVASNMTLHSSNVCTLKILGDGNANTVDFSVATGSSLTLSASGLDIEIKHPDNAANIATIDGSLTLGALELPNFGHKFRTDDNADCITTVNGTFTVSNGILIGTSASLIFSGTGIYNHNHQLIPGSLPVATWQSGSRTRIIGYTSNGIPPLNFSQTFDNFEWNCPSQTGSCGLTTSSGYPTVSGTLTITSTGTGNLALYNGTGINYISCNNFVQTGGTLNLSSGIGSTVFQASGTFNRTGGTLTESGTGTANAIEFNGSSAQSPGIGTVTNAVGFIINNATNVTANLMLNAAATLTMTKGNIIGNPTAPVWISSNGLVYNGTTGTQTGGIEVPPSVAALTINNADGVIFNSNINATGTLNLTNGTVVMANTGGILTLGTSASLAGTYNYVAGKIVGKFKRFLSNTIGARDFHVGTLADLRKVTINYTTAPATGGSITVEFITGDPGTGGLPATFGSAYINATSPTGYWQVNAANGLTGGTYGITVNATSFATSDNKPITNLSVVRLLKRPDGGNWSPEGACPEPASLDLMLISGLSSFSQFGVGGFWAALPVELLDFDVFAQQKTNLVKWSIAQQSNTREFLVERSLDGLIWEPLSSVTLNESGVFPQTYSLTDETPACLTYYRLRSIDFDGHEEMLGVRSVGQECGGFSIAGIYPNPATHSVTVNFLGKNEEILTLRLFDGRGRELHQQQVEAAKDWGIASLDVESFPAGLYFIVLESRHEKTFGRFLKQ